MANSVVVLVSLLCIRGILRKNIGFQHFNSQRSSFIFPDAAMPNEVDCESMQKGSAGGFLNGLHCHCQVPNPATAVVHITFFFSSGEQFLLTKNKLTEIGKAIWSSSKRNKNMKL